MGKRLFRTWFAELIHQFLFICPSTMCRLLLNWDCLYVCAVFFSSSSSSPRSIGMYQSSNIGTTTGPRVEIYIFFLFSFLLISSISEYTLLGPKHLITILTFFGVLQSFVDVFSSLFYFISLFFFSKYVIQSSCSWWFQYREETKQKT